MLKVIGNAFKRRKLTSELTKAEDRPAIKSEGQPTTQTTLKNSENKPYGAIISAEILDRARMDNAQASADDSACDKKQNRDIVFIDGGIPEIGRLLRELDPQADIHILHQQSDGIDQIISHLSGVKELQAIHLFCHGDRGLLNLGGGKLTGDVITTTYSKRLSKIRNSLSENGEILIYGCDFCGGTIGRAAAAQLSMLTGAEIAASPKIFEERKLMSSDVPRGVNLTDKNAIQPKVSELSYSVAECGLLDIAAENGLLHSAGLAEGTLKSVTDGSGASVKLNEPGASRLRTHILPNGAELTQFTNGAFTYQAETDAGSDEGELFTCLAVGSDQSLAKFTVSMKSIRPSETSSQPTDQAGDNKHAADCVDTELSPTPEQAQETSSRQYGRKFAGGTVAELSINIPDTSAGPILETTTMVDAPLIFLQRSRNAISINGSESDIIIVSLLAKNGTLSARPLKGAQVEGFNSVNLAISGSLKQINAALDGLRFVNSGDQHGSAELTVTAKYGRAPDDAAVSETVAIAVKSLETSIEVPSVSQDAKPSFLASSQNNGASNLQAADAEKPFIAEFTAPIGAVSTIANAGETMKLKEGDLTINRDGSFRVSLRQGYTSSASRVTCFVSGQSADPDYPPNILLDLARLPLQPGENFVGNVFRSDPHTSKSTFGEAVEKSQRITEAQSEPAKEVLETQAEPIEILSAVEETQIIRTSAPVVLAEQPRFTNESELIMDKTVSYSASEFDTWDVEEIGGHSLNFTFDRKGRQTAVTDTMQAGQLTIDTYKREQTLFLDVNSTFDPRDHGTVKSYQIELRDGSPYPEGMREIRNGFISIEASNYAQSIELKISALMQGGGESQCLVRVDGYSGTIKPVLDGDETQNVYQHSSAQKYLSDGFKSV